MLSLKTLCSLALAYLFIGTHGASISTNNNKRENDKFLKLEFDVVRTNLNLTQGPGLSQRDETVQTDLSNKQVHYDLEVFLGSDKQKVTVSLDTGSSDLWVRDSSLSTDDQGSYNPLTSKTGQNLGPGFQIAYGDGSSSTGNWVKDSVGLSQDGPTVDIQFGDTTQSSVGTSGILGIGYEIGESPVVYKTGKQYTNFPQALADAGLIKKNAYSLYLNSLDAEKGSIIFGGIDHAKYTGDLVEFSTPDTGYYLAVPIKSVSFGGQTYDINKDIVLDTGASYSLLPTDIAHAIAVQAFGEGNFIEQERSVIFGFGVSCPTSGDATFNFDGISITIPNNELFKEMPLGCGLLLMPDSELLILGDNFLRHAYVVYDLADKKISLAPVKFTSESNISVIS